MKILDSMQSVAYAQGVALDPIFQMFMEIMDSMQSVAYRGVAYSQGG